MTDVLLFDTADGGEILFENGSLLMSADGLETAVYLSWFGGNEDDTGRTESDSKQWWGNSTLPTDAHRYRAETQSIIQGLPLTSENLRELNDAAGRDLEWLVSAGVATEIITTATIAGADEVILTAEIALTDGTPRSIEVRKTWESKQ